MTRKARPRKLCRTIYVDRKTGERVHKGTKGAKKIKQKSDNYYIIIRQGAKRVPINLGTDDYEDACAAWRDWQRAKDDPSAAADAKPLDQHIADWLRAVRNAGTSGAQIALLETRIKHIAALARWRKLSDITADSCNEALASLQTRGHGRKVTNPVGIRGNGVPLTFRRSYPQGLSAQTRNHYLTHAKQFCNWLVDNERLRSHPLRRLKPLSVEADRRHDRYCPSDAEVAQLYFCPNLGSACGMSAVQRVLAYKVCACTGFRAKELRSLTAESFDFEAGTVTVRAAYSKRKRRDTQKLPPWLAAELQEWLLGGGELWQGWPRRDPGRVLRRDLQRAGLPRRLETPDGPLFWDFHSFRHHYITWAASQPDISIKGLQELARHSSPVLTLKVYAKAKEHELRRIVDRLPEPRRGGRAPDSGASA